MTYDLVVIGTGSAAQAANACTVGGLTFIQARDDPFPSPRSMCADLRSPSARTRD
jgi:hypothetical protein